MNEFHFNHLQNRKRLKLPRPILYVGVAIIFLAFFSIKAYKWASESADPTPSVAAVVETTEPVAAPFAAAVPAAVTEHESAAGPEDGEGILALDGEGARLRPPRRAGGDKPRIPPELLSGGSLDDPRIYVRVGRDGLVAEAKLVGSSGNDEVDRLVLDALRAFTFHPATTAGQTVEYASVVTVPLESSSSTAEQDHE